MWVMEGSQEIFGSPVLSPGCLIGCDKGEEEMGRYGFDWL